MARSKGRVPREVLAGCVAALLLAACAAPEPKSVPRPDERVTVKGPTLIAFLAPGGSPEQWEDVEAALSKTASCMEDGKRRPSTLITEAAWMKVKDEDREMPLYPPFEGTTGVFLLTPGRTPRYVDAVAGTRTLRTSVPHAAAQYFDVPGCAGVGP